MLKDEEMRAVLVRIATEQGAPADEADPPPEVMAVARGIEAAVLAACVARVDRLIAEAEEQSKVPGWFAERGEAATHWLRAARAALTGGHDGTA